MPPTDAAALRADLREKRKAFEMMAVAVNPDEQDTAFVVAYGEYVEALRAAGHLPPDPVEEALGAYREAVVAYAAYESTGRDIYWEHLRPAIAARRALDAAILGEANNEPT